MCNRDCFNCQYKDCIEDGVTYDEIKFQSSTDRDIVKHRAYTKQQRYAVTENGRNTLNRYNHSEKGIERRNRYHKSEKFKLTQKRYYERKMGWAMKNNELTNEDIMQTCRTYAKNNMNINKSAEELYITRGSFDYRLRIIKERTGKDPKVFFDLVKLLNGGITA